MFVTGLGIFLFPYVNDKVSDYESEKIIDEFEEDLNEIKDKVVLIEVDDETDEEDGEGETKEISILDKLYLDLVKYNERIYKEGQKDLVDPFSYETHEFDLTEYGFRNNVIGSIEIPSIDVKLAIYLGASRALMAHGAGVLGETSMPVGGNNTNVVIAGHRGYRGKTMFKHIDRIQLGDEIIITTPWGKLVYEVFETKVVIKDDSRDIFIRKDMEMLTLLTCHPYTKNTHRYLVFAKRVDNI